MNPCEQEGRAIACDLLGAIAAADEVEDRCRLMTAGVFLALQQPDPAAAMAGFAQRIAPTIEQAAQANGKALCTLAARAALAGHSCTTDAAGQITLSRWGRSMTFDDVDAATAWFDRVTGAGK